MGGGGECVVESGGGLGSNTKLYNICCCAKNYVGETVMYS